MSVFEIGKAIRELRRQSKAVQAVRAPDHTLRYHASKRRGTDALLDVYRPRSEGPHPSVLIVHGGGFVLGSRRMMAVACVAEWLADQGYVVAAPDYRKLFRGGAIAEGTEDVVKAWNFWRDQAEAHGGDPERTSLMGVSAGAALSMAALHHIETPHRAIGVYGPYDFHRLPVNDFAKRLLLGHHEPEQFAVQSPVADPHWDVPLYLQQGRADRLVQSHHVEAMVQARQERDRHIEVSWYDDDHAYLQRPDTPTWHQATRDLLTFLDHGTLTTPQP